MIRIYCDNCGNEINDDNRIDGEAMKAEIISKDNLMTIEVVTSTADMAKDCHFCKYCVIDAVSSLDDRPRAIKQAA